MSTLFESFQWLLHTCANRLSKLFEGKGPSSIVSERCFFEDSLHKKLLSKGERITTRPICRGLFDFDVSLLCATMIGSMGICSSAIWVKISESTANTASTCCDMYKLNGFLIKHFLIQISCNWIKISLCWIFFNLKMLITILSDIHAELALGESRN